MGRDHADHTVPSLCTKLHVGSLPEGWVHRWVLDAAPGPDAAEAVVLNRAAENDWGIWTRIQFMVERPDAMDTLF